MQVLLEAHVALGGLDRGVPQGDLDLLERRVPEVSELGKGAPEIVRRDLSEAVLALSMHRSTGLDYSTRRSTSRPELASRAATAPRNWLLCILMKA